MNAVPRPKAARRAAEEVEPRIVSIIPASPGWWAVWSDAAGEVLDPIAAFALVEDGWIGSDSSGRARREEIRYVEAMVHSGMGDASLVLASSTDGYRGLRYYAPGAEPVTAWASDGTA